MSCSRRMVNKTLAKMERNIDREYMRRVFEKIMFEGVELERHGTDDGRNTSLKNSDEN